MPLYVCDICDYRTEIRTHYFKHLDTKKHIKNLEKLEKK